MKIKDIMSTQAIRYCTPETKLNNASKIMKETNSGAIPVIDKKKKVIGIITDRDICLSISGEKTAQDLSVKQLLNHTKIHTIKTTDSVKDALREMREYKVGRLPVTDQNGKLKGMISINTLLSHALVNKEKIGKLSAKDENLAKTIKSLFERNNNGAPVKG